MCDWPIFYAYRSLEIGHRVCGNPEGGGRDIGNLSFCSVHFRILFDGVMNNIRKDAQDYDKGVGEQSYIAGMRQHGEFESKARYVLGEIDGRRRVVKVVEKETKDSWVYFAFCRQLRPEGILKIGWSTEPKARMRALARGDNLLGIAPGPLELLATTPGNRSNENYFHERFHRLRLHPQREWFHFASELQEFVVGLKDAKQPAGADEEKTT